MPTDHIRYDILAQEALRGVVRQVLTDVAKHGLPGEHHFFISFDTRSPGVRVSARLRSQYPEEMTIVLQHQFWDLAVTEHGFEAGLSFGGVAERLFVPFDAIKGFFDPSVQFGLQFDAGAAGSESDSAAASAPRGLPVPAKAENDAARAKPGRTKPAAAEVPMRPAPAAKPDEDRPPPAAPTGGEVVRFDRFRKK
jgi:hypothetical protein